MNDEVLRRQMRIAQISDERWGAETADEVVLGVASSTAYGYRKGGQM